MAQLTLIEKDKLERLFGMGSGWVLDFTDASFAAFFAEMNFNINDPRYTVNKTSKSKAKRLRGFWEQEDNVKVGTVLDKLIDYAEYLRSKNGQESTATDEKLISDCRGIASKLVGKLKKKDSSESPRDFLKIDFGEINFAKLPIEGQLQPILETRIKEAQICLTSQAYLSVIFMAGSILEGVLLGVAQNYPKRFNESRSCPKDDKTKKPKEFNKWTLLQFIDVGREINLIGEDVKKFSHALRDFRNYIHPYQQMASGFEPDKHTAEICMQVLKATLHDLIENKSNK